MEKSSKLKLGFIFALFLIFIVAVNPASSAFFGLFEDPITNVTVDDIVFNIPEGFEYNETMTNLTYLLTDDEFKNNNGDVKIYSSDSDNITIMVSDSKEAKISNLYSNGYDSKTVNGQKGAIKYMTDMEYYMYVFKKDDKLAVVYVTDDALLEDIITDLLKKVFGIFNLKKG